MRKIVEILSLESWTTKGKTHWRTTAMVYSKNKNEYAEAEGYGKDYKVGDMVEYWEDEKWLVGKMQKGKREDS